jgi:hypothetical protein
MHPAALSALAGLAWLAASAAPAAAQLAACSSLKIGAGGAYFQARASCLAKGLTKGVEPDPLCVAKALGKLQQTFGKVESKNECASQADLAPAEDVLADALADGLDAVSQITASCCANSNGTCLYRPAQDCTDSGGTPGAAGSACMADGTCGPIEAYSIGACCGEVDDAIPGLPGSCLTGATIGAVCLADGLPVTQSAACHPEIGCVLASEPTRSKCTGAKVKAQGRFLSAVAKCHAKALKKSQPVDLECLARAESKLTKAFAAAEKKKDCLGRGDLSAALGVLNDARELTVAILNPPTTFCCEGAAGCFYTTTGTECSDNGGNPIGIGECDADGTCTAPPLVEGGCCAGVPIGAIDRCVGGTTQVECTNLGGEYASDALCLMAQVCID